MLKNSYHYNISMYARLMAVTFGIPIIANVFINATIMEMYGTYAVPMDKLLMRKIEFAFLKIQ
jgi:hypothetical protein